MVFASLSITHQHFEMILEQLIGLLASFFSMLISRPPHISRQIPRRGSGSTFDESEEEDVPWVDMIHREYEEAEQELQIQTHDYTSATYVSVASESLFRRTFWQSLQRSLRANLGIVMVVIPLGLFAIGLVYFKLNTSDLCFEWKHHNNSISSFVTRWQLIGEDIDAMFLNIWFPVTLALLFGWNEFKSNYISTLWVGFAVGAVVVIYKTFLGVFNVFGTEMYEMYYRLEIFVYYCRCFHMLLLYVYLYIGKNNEMEVNNFFRNLLLDSYLIKVYGRHRRRILFLPGGPEGIIFEK